MFHENDNHIVELLIVEAGAGSISRAQIPCGQPQVARRLAFNQWYTRTCVLTTDKTPDGQKMDRKFTAGSRIMVPFLPFSG
jgi:hypothetical protein